jgi:aspartyl-tRNA(Asn)/glutamyl-tRNA(Gln) amidotransferase subunit C
VAAGTDDIRQIAALAKLSFSDDELGTLTGEMKTILDYMAHLSRVTLDGVEPAFSLLRRDNVFREDRVGEMLTPDDALTNAPDRNGDLFRVPAFLPED